MDTQNASAADAVVIVDVELDWPIRLGDQEVTTLKLRKPHSGELRGLSLVALGQMQVDELTKLLPRITIPTIPAPVIATIDPADMMEIANKVTDFLLTRRLRAALPTT